jgi:DNA-binding NarL/FixJ family response regulator
MVVLITDDSPLIRERLAKLRAHIRKQGLPTRVIVLINYASEHTRQKSLQLGAETFFDKSTEFAQAFDFLESTVPGADPMKHRAHCLLQFLALGENTITNQDFPDTESYPYISEF